MQHSSAAPALDQYAAAAVEATPVPPPAQRPQLVTELSRTVDHTDRAFQASLFGPQEVRRAVAAPAVRKPVPPPKLKREKPSQQSLFDPLADGARTLPTSVEAAVFCNAPVALPAHRSLAAALDTAVVLMAAGVFLVTCHFAWESLVLNEKTWMLYVAAIGLIAGLYKLIFCISNSDTLGSHWAGLQLLNFDGRRPTRQERIRRALASGVSLVSIGIGFLWAMVDEERLAWHDYISKTFPSPRVY